MKNFISAFSVTPIRINWLWPAIAGLLVFAACSAPPTPPAATATPRPVSLNGDNLHPAWTFPAGAPINAPPLPVNDDIVIVAPLGGPLTALDISDGTIRWTYAPPAGRVWERSCATDGRLIFVGLEGGRLLALEAASGEIVWQTDLGIEVQMSPLVIDDTLYVVTTFVGPGITANPNGRAKVFALSAADGRQRWAFETGNYILQTPAFDSGPNLLYVAGSYTDPTIEMDEGGPMRLYALSAADGALQWRYESEDGFVKALYAADGFVAFIAYQDFVNGLNAETGELVWQKDTGNWVPSLSGVGDTIYFGSANTVVHAMNIATGETRWQYNIGGGSFNYLLGRPVRAGDDLIFLAQQGDIIALNALDGSLHWRLQTDATTSRTSLSVTNGWLFAGDGAGTVFAYTDR